METREINHVAALAMAILEDFERGRAACSGLSDLPACELRHRRMLREHVHVVVHCERKPGDRSTGRETKFWLCRYF